MFCTQCGYDAGSAKFCGQCGAQQLFAPRASNDTPQAAPPRAPTPPIPPPPSVTDQANTGRPNRPPLTPPIPAPHLAQMNSARYTPLDGSASTGMADRVAATGKVVGLAGCLLALVFWVGVPLLVVLVALAASGSVGLAIVVGSLAIIAGFVYWVWRRTGP